MRTFSALLAVVLLALAGCGADDDAPAEREPEPAETVAPDGEGRVEEAERERPTGTRITVRDSEFGRMLFDTNRQAIYIFENDSRGESACHGECAEAWPPVLTDGEPRAARGVDQDLLGTIERRGGRLQVTYAGQPLYFYAHEAPGEVRCHNVNLHGGLWWVIGPDGERRP